MYFWLKTFLAVSKSCNIIAIIFARSFNQNVSASLDSLVMESATPYKNKLYRAVSRCERCSSLCHLHFLFRLSVSSMDLSQPSVASRKELWEGRAKNNQPCRNCQVSWISYVPSFPSRCPQRWTFPATGGIGSERQWWAPFYVSQSVLPIINNWISRSSQI